jgi:hypothetical protein
LGQREEDGERGEQQPPAGHGSGEGAAVGPHGRNRAGEPAEPQGLPQRLERETVGQAQAEPAPGSRHVGDGNNRAGEEHLGEAQHRQGERGLRGIEPAGELVGLGVVDPGQQRRVFGDPALPVALGGELGQRPVAGPAARLRRGPPDLGLQRLARPAALQVVHVDPLVGPGQQRRRGQVADLGAVSGHAPQDC